MLSYLLNVGFCIVVLFGGSYLIHLATENYNSWWSLGTIAIGLMSIIGSIVLIITLSFLYVTGLGR